MTHLPEVFASKGIELIGHSDLGGRGDGSHVNVAAGYAYVGHVGHSDASYSVLDVRDPRHPVLRYQERRPPGTHSHKVQLVDDVLLVNYERNVWESQPVTTWRAGLGIVDVADPDHPNEIAFVPVSGRGVHRMTFTEQPVAYVTGTDDELLDAFLRVIDLSDPSAPAEVGRWWYPGQHRYRGEVPTWKPTTDYCADRPPGAERYALHHALVHDGLAYCSWWDAGLVILDVRDAARPTFVGQLKIDGSESCCTHTALPLGDRGLVLLADEQLASSRYLKKVRIVDVSEPTAPRVTGTLPPPQGPTLGRVGPHNLHEMRPGSWNDSSLVFVTYCGGGLRVYDLSDPARPEEVAYFVPAARNGRPPHLMDVFVDAAGLVYLTDRFGGGLYIAELTL